MTSNVDPLVEIWLGSLRLSNNTVRTYAGGIGELARWAAPQGLPLAQVDEDDLHRYSLYAHQQGWSGTTVESRFGAVRNFYKWLFQTRRISVNPAANFRSRYGAKNTLTDVLGLKDLRTLLGAVKEARERSVLLLMLLYGLTADELGRLNVADFVRDDDGYRLRLPGGDTAPVPDLLAAELVAEIGDRKRGPLLFNRRGRRLTPTNVRLLAKEWAAAANLGVDVSPQIILASMRDVVINEPISMVSILQALGFGAVTNLKERAKLAAPSAQHLAVRMASLVRPDADSTAAYFDYADSLSTHHALPRAAGVALAGAAFERHLRELAIKAGAIPADIDKTTLGFLSGRLKDEGVLSEAEFKVCGTIGTTRDFAAHGWFEKVTDERADQAARDIRRIVADHPV